MSHLTKSYLLALSIAALVVMGTAMFAGVLIGPEIASSVHPLPLF